MSGRDATPPQRPLGIAPERPRARHEPLFPNAYLVARREYLEKVGSHLFHLSTVLLALLAVVLAFSPILVRAVDAGSTTRIGVVASDDALAERAITIMRGVLGTTTGGSGGYEFSRADSEDAAVGGVRDGALDAALVAAREPNGRLTFRFHAGDGIGAERTQLVSVGTLAVAILDWTGSQQLGGGPAFQLPTLDVVAATGPNAGGQPIGGAEYASRRIVGIVFIVLIFITVVIYGMWVAAGVVAEKSSRVMELIVSAASARQLVVGKVLGIGAAGLTQFVGILIPALIALAFQERVAEFVLGPGASLGESFVALSAPLVLAYIGFFVLGFTLYALVYAAAGSLVSRPEDLQVIALPLSLVAIGGYLIAIGALSGSGGWLVRFASYVPFWSPFVMLTRLTVARVEPWEIVLAFALLAATVVVMIGLAVRVYAAGVLLYGQRPGLRSVLAVVRRI